MTEEIDIKSVSKALAEEMKRRHIQGMKKLDLVKTVQSLEKANLKSAEDTLFQTNGVEQYTKHLPRKDSNRSAFDDEDDMMGGLSISNFSKQY